MSYNPETLHVEDLALESRLKDKLIERLRDARASLREMQALVEAKLGQSGGAAERIDGHFVESAKELGADLGEAASPVCAGKNLQMTARWLRRVTKQAQNAANDYFLAAEARCLRDASLAKKWAEKFEAVATQLGAAEMWVTLQCQNIRNIGLAEGWWKEE